MTERKRFDRLEQALRGPLLRPGDPDYDRARAVWNGMVDRRPAAIARCAGAEDVVAAVDFAREGRLRFTVRAGGHGVAGRSMCDDGLVIDLATMNDVAVDPVARTARVGAGATWRDFDAAAQAHGLATTGGTDPRTGVAGLTLGGGIGFLARKHGLAVDNVLAVDVLLADGELVRASADEHPDLYWALRGGGGSFGVVTSFDFRLHEVGPEVMVAQVFHRLEDAGAALRSYRDFSAGAPDEVGCYALFAHVPPVEPFPEELHGTTTIVIVGVSFGDLEEGRHLLEPLRTVGEPILEVTQPMPYTALQGAFEAGTPDGARYYFKSQFLSELTDDAIDAIVRRIGTLPGAFTAGGFEPLGGAVNRVAREATPFPHRDAAFNFSIFAGWSGAEDDDAVIAWTREFHRAMAPHASGGVYLNYLDDDDHDRERAAFGRNLERLRRVKARYDPDGLFGVDGGLRAGDADRVTATARATT